MRRALSSFVLLLLCATVFHAQKRAFTIEDLYRVKNISDLHLSPDGKTVMFVVTTSDLAHAKRTNRIWSMVELLNLRVVLKQVCTVCPLPD